MIVNKKSIFTLRLFTDLFILSVSFFVAGLLAQSLELFLSKNILFVLLALVNVLWYFSSKFTKLYDDSAVRLYSTTLLIIMKNILTQVVFAVLFIFFSKELLFTRNFIIFYGILSFVLVSVKHLVFQKILIRWRRENYRKLAIIGTGETAVKFKKLLDEHPEFGYKFIGYISTVKDDGTETIGGVDDLNSLITARGITDVVIAIPIDESELINRITRICDINATKCFIVPDYMKFVSKKFEISLFSDFPIISVRVSPLEEAQNRMLKRTLDLIISSAAFILVLWWLIPITALLIKLTSRGPVFFIQERVGHNDEIIRVYKFRSMYPEAKNKVAPDSIKSRDDLVTPIGKVLRKLNLDEIPQFINVLKGDMSIVGPRPHAINFNDSYKEIVEAIKLRTRVKPGITGWAQIHGLRGDVTDEKLQRARTIKRIEYDIWYIENWSVWLDIQILFETMLQILTGKNLGS